MLGLGDVCKHWDVWLGLSVVVLRSSACFVWHLQCAEIHWNVVNWEVESLYRVAMFLFFLVDVKISDDL